MLKVDIKNINLIDNGNSKIILSDIKFELLEGKIYTILGKNGSGKSTLIKSLTNLLNQNTYQTNAEVFWNDINIMSLSDPELLSIRKNEIKYVFQDLNNNFDPLKKIKYYFGLTNIKPSLIVKQLSDFLLPDLKTVSNLHSYELSGGMAQRLSLLLALIVRPKLLILDEPTSAIDYINMNLTKNKLKDFVQFSGTVLMVTQDVEFAKNISDEIAFLNNGNLSEFKSTNNFFADFNLKEYANFINSYNELR